MLATYMMHSITTATFAPRAAVMTMLEPVNAPRSPISGRRTKVALAAAEAELHIFRVAEPVVDDPSTSCWLAPDGEHGEFTVDLLRPESIGRLSLQNTNNRGMDDRGSEEFEAFGSLDNKSFFPLAAGRLPRVVEARGEAFPFHDFRFAPVQARYVKIVVTRHFRHLQRPAGDPHHGGGLNEIRIFP